MPFQDKKNQKSKFWLAQILLLLVIGYFIFFDGEKSKAQIFIPQTYWGCKSVSATQITTNTSTDFSLGTFSNTTLSGDAVTLSVGQSSGTYTSKILDLFGGCPPFSAWSGIDWITPNPYGKEIPTSDETAIEYPSVTTGLTTGLQIYNRLNGSGNIANGASVTSTVGVNAAARNANGSGMTYSSGALRTAVTFDGTDDFLEYAYTQTNVNAYTIAAWFRTTTAGNGVFVQNRGSGAGRSLTLAIGNNPGGCAAGRVSYGVDSNGIYIGKCTSNTYNNGQWRHAVGVWSGTSGTGVATGQFTIYIDGTAVSQTNTSIGSATAPLTGLGNTKMGRHDAWTVNYNGSLDEVLIWNRALSAAEVQQLYQRAGNNIRFQIRTCDNSDCSDGTWKGTSNTNTSYFSELNNTTIPDSNGGGTVLNTYPRLNFADFPSLVVDYKRFFQYQATLTTSNTTIIPYLNSTNAKTTCAAGSITYNSSGAFTLPPLCTQMTVTVNGAGAATGRRTGGGTRANAGRGGQAVKTLTGQIPGSVYSVTVGTGGLCAQTAGTGAYDGGAGGATNSAGSPGVGPAGAGGTAGTGGGSGFSGGTGNYGGGGGGGGGAANTGGGGAGAASSVSLSGVELVVAGGGGGSGGSANGAAGTGGSGCSGAASGDYTRGGNGGNAPGSASGGGGGGGRCYCTGGCNSASALGGLAGDTAGTACQTSNDGASGSVTIDYQE
jgi:hypothetical protein